MDTCKIPRGTFWMGGAVGLALGLPLLSLLLCALAHALGVGDPSTGFDRIGRIAMIFAGLPAFLTGGGVARLAAHRLRDDPGRPSPKHALVLGAAAMSTGGIGLAYLVAVPLGGMPGEPLRWMWLALAGGCAGGLTGLTIGGLVGLRSTQPSKAAPA